jgi:membrane associated rhomboid family serine protease
MIIPLGDDNRDRRTTPYVNYIFIAINVLVFVLLQGLGTNTEFTYSLSTVPEEILTGRDIVTEGQVVQDPQSGRQMRRPGLGPTPITVYITLITSMFMHGGFGHILGNMLYLFIFGDNIEDRIGHGRYALFYLGTGILASLAHVFTTALLDGNTMIPSLGASGAISAVLGAYLLLFPRKRVYVILVRIVTAVPAVVAIGIWIAFQLIRGAGSLGGGTGVAYAAHIGGFVAGVALIKLFDVPPSSPRRGRAPRGEPRSRRGR